MNERRFTTRCLPCSRKRIAQHCTAAVRDFDLAVVAFGQDRPIGPVCNISALAPETRHGADIDLRRFGPKVAHDIAKAELAENWRKWLDRAGLQGLRRSLRLTDCRVKLEVGRATAKLGIRFIQNDVLVF